MHTPALKLTSPLTKTENVTGDSSNTTSTTTTTTTTRDMPKNFSYENQGTVCIIRWDTVHLASYYEVEYGGSIVECHVNNGSITGAPDGEHEIYIRAVGEDENGNKTYSEWAYFTFTTP